MRIQVAEVRKCLKAFDFPTLFREHLGWDKHHGTLDIPIDGSTMRLSAVAQKRGFVAYVCWCGAESLPWTVREGGAQDEAATPDQIPDRPTRLKVDHQVTKSARQHFIIYADKQSGQQVWHWVRREPGKPLASRDHRFDASQSGEHLIQRLEKIAVSMEEEEQLTHLEITGKAKAAFDVDKVTKKFYERFKAEHAAFLKFIKGIKSRADLEWYTSLMLNRLMFVYFIQKKGFLDGDTNYLQNRMRLVREAKGKDKFLTFYSYFLVRLFHDGLGKSPEDRKLNRDLEKLLGKVPYLNGGFFEVHQLEERNKEIDIPDKAFEKLFAFFDEFRWHLDERPLRANNTGVGHWFCFTLNPPKFWRNGRLESSTRESSVYFRTKKLRDTAYCCLSSSMHYWLYQARTNCRDYNPSDLAFMPLPEDIANGLPEFTGLASRIMKRLEETSEIGEANYAVGGLVKFQRFRPKAAKELFDSVDDMLAGLYGLTPEQQDFIINYDVKYRMGLDGTEDDE